MLGFFSHFFMHSACDGARVESKGVRLRIPKRLVGGSTAELQTHLTLLTEDARMNARPFFKRLMRVQATASSLCYACLRACASLGTPPNQFHILCHVLRCLRLNIAFLRYIEITVSTVLGGDMSLTSVNFPPFRLPELTRISRILELQVLTVTLAPMSK